MKPRFSIRLISISVSLLLLVSITGCDRQQGDPGLGTPDDEHEESPPSLDTERAHPSDEAIPGPNEVDFVLDRNVENVSSELDSLAEIFRSLTNVATHGEPEGPSEEIFGFIQDISIDSDGNLYVLDSRYNEVVMLDRRGAYSGSFGEPGQGPNEFSHPDRLTIGSQGRMVVAERAQLKIFEQENETFSLRNTTPHQTVFTRDICMIDNYLYTRGVDLGQEDSGSIQVYSPGGDHSATFGHTYPIDDIRLNMSLSDGFFACNTDSGQLVSGYNYLPIIHSYNTDGTLQWQVKIADYVPSNVLPQADGGTFYGSDDPTDHTRFITFISNDHLIVQIAHRTPESRREQRPFETLHSYLLNSESGEGTYIGTSLPPIYHANDDFLIAATNYPYPKVNIYVNPLEAR